MADETQTKEARRERLADADRRPPGSPAEVGKLDTLKRTVVAADPTFATLFRRLRQSRTRDGRVSAGGDAPEQAPPASG